MKGGVEVGSMVTRYNSLKRKSCENTSTLSNTSEPHSRVVVSSPREESSKQSPYKRVKLEYKPIKNIQTNPIIHPRVRNILGVASSIPLPLKQNVFNYHI